MFIILVNQRNSITYLCLCIINGTSNRNASYYCNYYLFYFI